MLKTERSRWGLAIGLGGLAVAAVPLVSWAILSMPADPAEIQGVDREHRTLAARNGPSDGERFVPDERVAVTAEPLSAGLAPVEAEAEAEAEAEVPATPVAETARPADGGVKGEVGGPGAIDWLAEIPCEGLAEIQLTAEPFLRTETSILDVEVAEPWVLAGSLAYGARGAGGLYLAAAESKHVLTPKAPDVPGRALTSGLAVSGNLVVAAWVKLGELRASSARLYRISESRLRLIGEIKRLTYDMAIDGDVLYLAHERGGISSYDIASPQRPEPLGSLQFEAGWARCVLPAGDVLYVANGGDLRTVDIADPSVLRSVYTHQIDGTAMNLAIEGPTLAVAAREGGVVLFDVSDPWRPVYLSAIETPDWAEDVAFWRGMLIVTHRYHRLEVLDISNRRRPRRVAAADLPQAYRLSLRGDAAVVADGDLGVRTIDLSRCLPPSFEEQPRGGAIEPGGAGITLTARCRHASEHQWYRNGEPVRDGLGVRGATTPTLELAALFANAGDYQLRIKSGGSFRDSTVARVIVD